MPFKQFKQVYNNFPLRRKITLDKVVHGTTPRKSLYALSFGHVKSTKKANRIISRYSVQVT